VLQNVFPYLGPFERGSRVWRTDRRTDGRTYKTGVSNSAV